MITFCNAISLGGDSPPETETIQEEIEPAAATVETAEQEAAVDGSTAEQDYGNSNRLRPEAFTYLGAFRLPSEFDWGARGITYYPKGDSSRGSLLVTGFEAEPALFGEVTIPQPIIEANWEALPSAELLREPTSFDGSLIETQLDSSTTYAGDIEYVPKRGSQESDKIYGSADWWYAVEGVDFPTIWFAELDGSNPRGLFHVGEEIDPFHGNRTGDYLFTVPQWYADQYLGGRVLMTGKSRGTDTGSQGPSLYAFSPWEEENPQGNLDAIPILWYRFIYPECAGPNVGDKSACDYPDFTMCDKWLGGSFVESGEKRAIIFFGVKGLGENGYGQPQNENACNPYQGYHCDPLERQVIFYDIDELGEAAQGKREAWTVVPYQIWRPEEFYLGDTSGYTCGEPGGMTFDPLTRRLFMVEKGLGDNNAAVVHVWVIE
jgi:hypothetical protein